MHVVYWHLQHVTYGSQILLNSHLQLAGVSWQKFCRVSLPSVCMHSEGTVVRFVCPCWNMLVVILSTNDTTYQTHNKGVKICGIFLRNCSVAELQSFQHCTVTTWIGHFPPPVTSTCALCVHGGFSLQCYSFHVEHMFVIYIVKTSTSPLQITFQFPLQTLSHIVPRKMDHFGCRHVYVPICMSTRYVWMCMEGQPSWWCCKLTM